LEYLVQTRGKKVSNRLRYLKSIQEKNFVAFLEIAQLHGVNLDGTLQPQHKPTLLPSPVRLPVNCQLQLLPLPLPLPSAALALASGAYSPTTTISSRRGREESPSPAIIMLMSHHGMNKHPSFTNDLEFTLDFEKPEKNPCGIMVFRANDVKHGSKLIDKVTILKPLYDPRDCKLLKATLDADGLGITYTELSSPSYFLKDASLIHGAEKEHKKTGLACKKTEQAHLVAANSIQSKEEELCLQHVRLKMSCKVFTQLVHRVAKKEGKLKNLFRMVEVKIGENTTGKDLMWHAPYIVWVFMIDREACHRKRQESDGMSKVSMNEE
jgi:hypothetical protein